MLMQPASVRRSYVRDVLERAGGDELEQAWMLRQPDHVRESYINEVLEAPGSASAPGRTDRPDR